MPTIITHPAAALGLLPWFRGQLGRPAVLITGMALTVAPDLDVIGFALGIPYGDLLGHRGLSHSLPFALAFGAAAAWPLARLWRVDFRLLWLYFFLCLASHGLLDALTGGGLGIAFFAPFTNERYFLDFRPIRVSDIGVGDFRTGRWMTVLLSELRWVWLPALGLAATGLFAARLSRWRRPAMSVEAD